MTEPVTRRDNILKKDQTILLSRSSKRTEPEKYTIRTFLGEGGSCVAYEAERILENGRKQSGILKEYYPLEAAIAGQVFYCSFKRLDDGQLLPSVGGTLRYFNEMCEAYIEKIKKVDAVMTENRSNEILKNYIQKTEILYGYEPEREDQNQPTIYFWQSGFSGCTLDRFLNEEIRKDPQKRSDKKLSVVLKIMDELTDCIKALHTAGILHLDIKPDNFMVAYDSDHKVPDSNIKLSLFDIDTFYFYNDPEPVFARTPGYSAPEIEHQHASYYSDIYSLGAFMFHAVIIHKDVPDGIYDGVYYNSLGQFVKQSSLFKPSRINSDAILIKEITDILENCLARKESDRYDGCAALLKDIRKAERRLSRLRYTPVPESSTSKADPELAMCKVLYDHPLYENVNASDKINVLIVAGKDSQNAEKFADLCLQDGQMVSNAVSIVFATRNPIDEKKKVYLAARPALSEFISIDGNYNEVNGAPYSYLNFLGIGDDENWFSRDEETNQQLTDELLRDNIFDYVFIDISMEINQSLAKLIKGRMDDLKHPCTVVYASKTSKDSKDGIYKISVNSEMKLTDISPVLLDMAYNTNIIWDSKFELNNDPLNLRESFFRDEDQRYNRISSMTYALGIFYKLHSIGIDNKNPLEAADRFQNEILSQLDKNPAARDKFDTLVDLEHRRWLIEKAAEGYTAPRDQNGRLDYEMCLKMRDTKDKKQKKHICMVRGSAKSPLSSDEYQKDSHKKWDEPVDPSLDDLDRMSVELHQFYKKYAEDQQYSYDDKLKTIGNLIPEKDKNAVDAFRQYEFAIKNILDGAKSYCQQYSYYEKALADATKNLKDGKNIREEAHSLGNILFPQRQCCLYVDYKANDEVLVRNIPFILTYRYQEEMVISFTFDNISGGRTESLFQNVAAATVLGPTRIKYLYYDDGSSLLFPQKMYNVLTYFEARRYYPEINVIIVTAADERHQNTIKENISVLTKKDGLKLHSVECYSSHDYKEAADIFLDSVEENNSVLYDGDNPLFPSNYENTIFIQEIHEREIPYFEFNWKHKQFHSLSNCEYLKYAKDNSFLRIRDMFALGTAADRQYNHPQFYEDYIDLWNIYTGNNEDEKKYNNAVSNWNRFCDTLAKYEESKKPIYKVTLFQDSASSTIKEVQIQRIPADYYDFFQNLLAQLIKEKFVDENSRIVRGNGSFCRLQINADERYIPDILNIFNVDRYANAGMDTHDNVKIIVKKSFNDYSLEIRNDSLKVENLLLESKNGINYSEKVYDKLCKAKFIRQLNEVNGKVSKNNGNVEVSFQYASKDIKRLLTSAGEILEIYAYYECLKTGYFDDVATGFEFSWATEEVQNELDLILTKGFRSMIIECKAVIALEMGYYHKLDSIANKFGIGCNSAIVANLHVNYKKYNDNTNDLQIKRGRQLGIYTISSHNKIINIGRTLKEMMESLQ